MKKLLLIGAGGHCRSVLDSVLSSGDYDEIGIIDRPEAGQQNAKIIGTDEDLPRLAEEGWSYAFITVGSIGVPTIRKRLYQTVKELGFYVPAIIDPSATIAKGVMIQEGVFVGKRAIVNTGSKIDVCAIINTGAIIEHDCTVGAFVHISPGTILCGQVHVGKDTHIGAGTVVRQSINIGDTALIGIGSVVVKDVPGYKKAFGNPCRVIEK